MPSIDLKPLGGSRVAIVGAGIAGLYAAHLLQQHNIYVHLYEVNGRAGGRIFTHRFTHDRDQYFEAGAMRIPDTATHRPVFDLIRYLNDGHGAEIKVIPYVLNNAGNRVFVNGNRRRDGVPPTLNDSAYLTAMALGFDVPDPYKGKTADELLHSALEVYLDLLNTDFELGWRTILKYDDFTFREYLRVEAGWPESVIDFVETVCSQTNQYTLSFPEIVMQNLDFGTEDWKTVADGMDRIPQALASVVGLEHISFNARVWSIQEIGQQVKVRADTKRGPVEHIYDKVIMAIPPSALRMISERPRWSPGKELAIRSIHFEALYKIGLRFKTRFWERTSPPSFGGQTTTDTPVRWIVYPSYGIGSDGPGVLLLYSWMSDASFWSSIPFTERVRVALRYISEVYTGEVDVYAQFIEAEDMAWSEHNPTGDCMLLPGYYTSHFEVARKPEGNVYFAGEHLSRHHTWIVGAMESAKATSEDIIRDFGNIRSPITKPSSSHSDSISLGGDVNPKYGFEEALRIVHGDTLNMMAKVKIVDEPHIYETLVTA